MSQDQIHQKIGRAGGNMEETETNQQLSDQELKEKLENEIAPVCWHDLQIIFARGIAIFVSPELKLSEVAFEISKNNTTQVDLWMGEEKLTNVKDEQALEWYNDKAELLTAIVKPWVLVQEMP